MALMIDMFYVHGVDVIDLIYVHGVGVCDVSEAVVAPGNCRVPILWIFLPFFTQAWLRD